jgi:hypothetical protein
MCAPSGRGRPPTPVAVGATPPGRAGALRGGAAGVRAGGEHAQCGRPTATGGAGAASGEQERCVSGLCRELDAIVEWFLRGRRRRVAPPFGTTRAPARFVRASAFSAKPSLSPCWCARRASTKCWASLVGRARTRLSGATSSADWTCGTCMACRWWSATRTKGSQQPVRPSCRGPSWQRWRLRRSPSVLSLLPRCQVARLAPHLP